MTTLAVSPPATGTPPAGQEWALRARAVVRRYRNGRGVGPIDLDIAAGETVALMGANGCGKTTLLRLLATVSRPQRGTLRWGDGDADAARQSLGLALDGAFEDPGLTGRQATHFWCAQWVGDARAVATRTATMLDQLDLSGAADHPVATYSYGMRRRLALAAALVHEPRLALLDEPTAGLDPDGVGRLEQLVRERARRRLATLVASNDPRFVESVAQRVAFIDEGAMVRCASPHELLAALPQGRIADLVVADTSRLAALRAVPGVVDVSVEAGARVRVRFEGDSTVAALVAAADAPGGQLRELRLRRPDLADCFTELTGRLLEPGG